MRLDIVNDNIKGNINKKICLISDIHFYKPFNNKVFDILKENIDENKPDYICVPGDLVTEADLNDKDLKPLYSFFEELGSKYKVIISIGNHDISVKNKKKENKHFFEKLNSIKGVEVLINDSYIDENIRFIGYLDNLDATLNEKGYEKVVTDEFNELLDKVNIDSKYYNILLCHNPIYISRIYKDIKKWAFLSLVLSGHTHGGIFHLKGNSGLISPCKKLFPKEIRGHYLKNKVHIIISDGVTKLSYSAKLFRHFNFLFPISINYINISKKSR